MTPEFWAIVGVGVGIGSLVWRLDIRIGRLDERMAYLGERMAKLEGAMDGFTKGFSTGREVGAASRPALSVDERYEEWEALPASKWQERHRRGAVTYKIIFRDTDYEDILVRADDMFLRDDHYVFVCVPPSGGELTTAGMVPVIQVRCIVPVSEPEPF